MTATRIATVPLVRPVLEVAVGDVDQAVGQAVYDTARYDAYPAATYAGLDADWTDAGCDVVEAVTFCGRQRSVDAFDIGTATLRVHNPAGLWDYPPPSPPLTPLSVRPGRMARVGVVVDDAPPVWLFTGWIDSTAPAYDAASSVDAVDVGLVDAKGQAGRTEVGRGPAVGAGETVTARMARYADLAGFPAHRRQFDASGITLGRDDAGRPAGRPHGSVGPVGGRRRVRRRARQPRVPEPGLADEAGRRPGRRHDRQPWAPRRDMSERLERVVPPV